MLRNSFHFYRTLSISRHPIGNGKGQVDMVLSPNSLAEGIMNLSPRIKGQQQQQQQQQQVICQVYMGSGFTGNSIEEGLKLIHERLQPDVLVGCVVSSVRLRRDHQSHWIKDGLVVCQHGVSHDERVIPFVHAHGRNMDAVVGRYHSKERQLEDKMDMEVDLSHFKTISTPAFNIKLPPELEDLAKNRNEKQPVFFLMGDKNTEPFLNALDLHFPQSEKIGMIGASTPFLNGQPFTLFQGNTCHSNGMVGFALISPLAQTASRLKKSGTLIGSPMQVTKSRGNIILEVNQGQNPTKLLLEAIKQRGFAARKDEAFFLAVYDKWSEKMQIEKCRVHQITSGDPKKRFNFS